MAGERIEDTYSIDTTDAVKSINKLEDAQEKAGQGAGKFKGKLGDLFDGFGGLADGAEKLTLGLNDLSSGGFAGGLGNLTNFAAALGSGGLVGALGVAALGVVEFGLNYTKWFGEEVPKFTSNIEKLESELKSLGEKPAKVGVDFTQIAAATAELDRLKANLAAFDALAATSSEKEAQQAAAAREAAAKGGYSGVEGRERLLQETVAGFGSQGQTDAAKEAAMRIEIRQKQVAESEAEAERLRRSGNTGLSIRQEEARTERLRKELEAATAEFQKEQRAAASNLLGGALGGQSDSLAELQKLARGGSFNDEFSRSLLVADSDSQARIAETKRRQKEALAEKEEREKLEREIENRKQSKSDSGLLERVKRGEKTTGEEEQKFLRPQKPGTEFRAMDLDDAKAAAQAAAKAKADAEADAKAKAAQANANAAATKRIDAAASAFSGGFGDQVQFELARGTDRGKLTQRLEQIAKRNGVRSDEADDVAAKVVADAANRMNAEFTRYMAVTGQAHAANAAVMADLANKLQSAQEAAMQSFQNAQRLRQSLRTQRPSLLGTFQ